MRLFAAVEMEQQRKERNSINFNCFYESMETHNCNGCVKYLGDYFAEWMIVHAMLFDR